jgi:endo-1,4-beta-xylanase
MGTGFSNVDISVLGLKWAKEENPDAILLANDNALLHTWQTRDRFISYVEKVISNGGVLDGIGAQGHFWASIELPTQDELYNHLNHLYVRTGLPIYITEFDIIARGDDWEVRQPEAYRNMFEVFSSHPAVKQVDLWGFADKYLPSNIIGLVDESFRHNPVVNELAPYFTKEV